MEPRPDLSIIGWGGNAGTILDHMAQNPKTFVPQKLAIQWSIATIEEQLRHWGTPSTQRLFSMTQRLGDLDPTVRDPETTIYLYGAGDIFDRVLMGIRSELSRRLIQLLPGRGK